MLQSTSNTPAIGIETRFRSALASTDQSLKHGIDHVEADAHTAMHAAEVYTEPRADTGGNLKSPSFFLAAVQGSAAGFSLLGPAGIVAGAGSAMVGVEVVRETHSRVLGVLAGAATGAAVAAAAGALIGGAAALVPLAAGAALTGAFLTLQSDGDAKTRDAGLGATMLSALVVNGPAKLAGGVAAALGAKAHSKIAKALIGVGTGAALGTAMALIGAASGPVVATALAAGAMGAIGPSVGPRLMQGLRNLGADIGTGLSDLSEKVGLTDHPIDVKARDEAGSIPIIVARSLAMSGGDLVRAGLMTGANIVRDGYILYKGAPQTPPTPDPKPT